MATWYPFSNVTPSDPNSIQAIVYTALSTGDKAVGEIEAGTVAMFKYDTTSSATEDIPNVITSDGNAGNGRWIRIEFEHINHFFNGTFEESFDALVTSDGATITMSLEKSGGGNLTCQFEAGFATHAAGSIALTAGTDAAPQANYIYILATDPTTLVKSTTQWPATEHIKVGYFLVPTAAHVAAEGVYINQNWNDHLSGTDDMGHLAHICETIRLTLGGAKWHSGVEPNGDATTYIVTTGTPDEVYFKATAGVAYQMHKHTVPAYDMQTGDDAHVVNWSGDAYHQISDLASIIADSTGATLNNKYYNLVFWGTANKTGEYSPLMINVPGGSYNTLSSAIADTGSYDVTTIPHEFIGDSTTGFLICRLTLRLTGGSSFTLHDTVDYRGLFAGTAGGVSGGSGGTLVNFPDNTLTIYDSDDVTRILDFDLTGITTGNTRTVTPADADMTIPSSVNHDDLTDGGDTDLHKHDTVDSPSGQVAVLAQDSSGTRLNYNAIRAFQTSANGIYVYDTSGGTTAITYYSSTGTKLGMHYMSAAGWNLQLGTANENAIIATLNGSVELLHDNLTAFRTAANGVGVYDPVGTAAAITFYSDVPTQIGKMYFSDTQLVVEIGASDTAIIATLNGGVDLFYNSIKQGETQSGYFLATNAFQIAAGNQVDIIRDEDDMASNDLRALCTQQSIKTYVDAAASGFAVGTKMYFYQAAAPTGWTIDNTLGDAVLAVHGSSSYHGSASGGVRDGSWTMTGISASAGNVGGTAISDAQMNTLDINTAALHTLSKVDKTYLNLYGTDTYATSNKRIAETGSNFTDGRRPESRTQGTSSSSHNHSGSTITVTQGSTYRPYANVGIIATKD